jgi:LmbE family N-acetylglucosaminyl deacetylase
MMSLIENLLTEKRNDRQFLALVLAPHTDDGEFGCGGTISRIIESGGRVIYVAFSAAEQSVPAHMPKDILRHEVLAATSKLGIPKHDCIVLDFQVRRFQEKRQEILDTMIELGRKYQPHVVFLPSERDTHQDHVVIAHEGFRAFKRTTLLGYEIPWNNLSFRTNCFVVLQESHLAAKVEALRCYESQAARSYANAEFIKSLMVTRGTQINKSFAEAFEVNRLVIN